MKETPQGRKRITWPIKEANLISKFSLRENLATFYFCHIIFAIIFKSLNFS